MQESFKDRDENPLENDSEQTMKKNVKPVFVVSMIVLLVLVMIGGYFLFNQALRPALETPAETTETQTTEKPADRLVTDEIRGVYIASVSNINFPSRSGLSEEQLQKELDAIVTNCDKIGFDTIYFQVRPSADALYHSELFPTSRYLSGEQGKDVSFDPLAYLIQQASAKEMKVVAWVNPYRVTVGKYDTKEEALDALSEENFAKHNPDCTVFYGGKLYFDPGSEAVQKLIADGVREICEGYDVAGILYDDYFYPYPVSGEVFEDSITYEGSESDLDLSDWRRENVNKMVKLTYDTVKSVSKDMTFGISPFGIWKNSSSDPMGSNTRGLEAYSTLYCDALAWIKGGYIDYISPQIYWERGFDVADFSTLTRWWSKQVEGTDVKLVISHAAYRAGSFEQGGEEIAQQIRFARDFDGAGGNIQYGYADIVKNTSGVADAIMCLYDESADQKGQLVSAELADS